MERVTLSASSLDGTEIQNPQGEDLGHVKDLMINMDDGSVEYAVLSFGGVLGMGDKLFAVPFDKLEKVPGKEKFCLAVDKEKLEDAPGFDKDNWPNFADSTFRDRINAHYSVNH